MCGEFHVSTTPKFDLIHDRLTEDREKSRKISDQYEFKLVMMRKNCVSWLFFFSFYFLFSHHHFKSSAHHSPLDLKSNKMKNFFFWIFCSKNSKHQQVSPFDFHFLLPFVGGVAIFFLIRQKSEMFSRFSLTNFTIILVPFDSLQFEWNFCFLSFLIFYAITVIHFTWYAAHFFFYFYVCHPLLPPIARDFPTWTEKVARFHYIEMSRLT